MENASHPSAGRLRQYSTGVMNRPALCSAGQDRRNQAALALHCFDQPIEFPTRMVGRRLGHIIVSLAIADQLFFD
jgi:hypothetical protein